MISVKCVFKFGVFIADPVVILIHVFYFWQLKKWKMYVTWADISFGNSANLILNITIEMIPSKMAAGMFLPSDLQRPTLRIVNALFCLFLCLIFLVWKK